MSWESELFGEDDARSVTEYTREIKRLLEGGLAPCWVQGEISNLRLQSSGHLYFTLKDAGAQLPAVMFRANAAGLRFRPRDGLEVSAFGQVSVYEPHGKYQLIVRSLKESGVGRLHREFERLKQALAAEGLFDKGRKRALPVAPMRVAIVTSPTGAALQDFARILRRRDWPGRLTVIPVTVQGNGAAEEIARGIEFANDYGRFDLIVIGRGGGSMEDLWCFNEAVVVRAVAGSSLPVISAVGHEIDFALSDFAADVRAETPSAAAEIISSLYLDFLDRLQRATDRLEDCVADAVDEARGRLEKARLRLSGLSPRAKVEHGLLRVDELDTRLRAVASRCLRSKRDGLRGLSDRLAGAPLGEALASLRERLSIARACFEPTAARRFEDLRKRVREGGIALKAMGPQATLNRGFAILESPDGKALTSVAKVRQAGRLSARLKDGAISLGVAEEK